MDIEKIMSDLEKVLNKNETVESTASSLSRRFAEEIKKVDGDYQKQLASQKEEAEKEAKAKEDLQKSVVKLQKDLEDTKNSLEQVQGEKEKTEAIARNESRLRKILDAYNLSDEEKEIVAQDVASLDAKEESFASYEKRVSILFKNRSHEAVAAQKEEMDKKVRKEIKEKLTASKIDSLDKILASIEEPVKPNIPNSSDSDGENLSDKANRVFGESIKVK